MARVARPGRPRRGREPRPVPHVQAAQAGPPAARRPAAADPDPLHQHDQPRAGAVLPGRRGARAADPPAGPLERRGDGPPGQQPVRRASAATSRRTPRPRPSTRSASTTSSGARTTEGEAGDQVFYQGHAAPGIYARAFLEGRLSRTSSTTSGARVAGAGSAARTRIPGSCPTSGSSPRSRWASARSARSTRRGSTATSRTGASRTRASSRVWAFLGDGEMDEPESIAGAVARRPRGPRQPDLRRQLQPPAARRTGPRQRQDHPGARGPVPRRRLERDQGRLGPRVGRAPRPRRRRRPRREDERHARRRVPEVLRRRAAPTSASTSSGRTRACAAWSSTSRDDDLAKLRRGGHDYRKVYAAYKAATEYVGAPTVILAKTIKGWTLGPGVEARNITHQAKKMSETELKIFRDRLELPIPDAELKDAPYYHPGPDSEEVRYLSERRRRARRPAAEAGRPRAAVRCRLRRRPSTPSSPAGSATAGQHHDGLHPDAAQPHPRPRARAADRADHPRRGAHVRHGSAVQGGRHLRRARPALRAGRLASSS